MNYFEHKEPVFDHSDDNSAERELTITSIIDNQPKKAIKKRKKRLSSFASYWLNLIFLFAIGFSLLGIDFILHNATAGGSIFASFPVLRSEIMLSLTIIAVLCGIIYFCLSGFTILLCILTGGIAYLSFYAFLNQFADFSTLTTLGYSSVYIAGAGALLVFSLLFFSNTKFRFLLAIIILAVFGFVFHKCNHSLPESSVEIYQNATASAPTKQKIVNIMLPSLPSYALLSTLDDQNTNKFYRDQLLSIMMGFYAKYNFKLYTNAFTKSGNPYLNAADSLNMSLPEDIYANLQNKLIKTNRWNFGQHNNFDIYMQNYKLLDLLKEQGYNINAYQSSGINLCQKNNQNVVNRCTTQNTFPSFQKHQNTLSTLEQSAILLINWLESTRWMDWLAKPIYQSINHIFSADNIPTIGNSYKKISVINSIQTLNTLFADISKDEGNNAYFVLLDFSDMFLFDDMCQLKDISSWQVKNNHQWAKQNNTMEKRSAYFQQAMCLYGKLSQFMQNLQNIGALNNTVVIIQGLNGIDDLHEDEALLTSFLNTQMSPLAIYTPENKSFSINKSICPSPSIIKQLFTKEKCIDFEGTNIAKSTRNNIIQHINSVSYTSDKIQNYYREYSKWLRSWNEKNFQSAASSSVSANTPEPEPEIIRPKAQLIPLEEKTITTQKVTQKTITSTPETKVESISTAAQKTPLIEE